MRIAFGEFYRDAKIFDVSQRLGIELVDMSKTRRDPERGEAP